jgi:hypothetical protein
VVEHFLGREEVVSSILTNGSLSDGLHMTKNRESGVLLNSEQEVEGCDATKADSSNAAGFIINNNN